MPWSKKVRSTLEQIPKTSLTHSCITQKNILKVESGKLKVESY
jgi:hypothetical protein